MGYMLTWQICLIVMTCPCIMSNMWLFPHVFRKADVLSHKGQATAHSRFNFAQHKVIKSEALYLLAVGFSHTDTRAVSIKSSNSYQEFVMSEQWQVDNKPWFYFILS